jgi:hypothetical protein
LDSIMRATPAETRAATPEGQSDGAAALDAMLDRISAERAACEKLSDPELAQRAGRNVLAAIACAADAVLADATMLQSAPDKLAGFFEKSAAACIGAIDALHKRAVLTEAAANAMAPGRSRVADSRLDDFAVWGPPKTS